MHLSLPDIYPLYALPVLLALLFGLLFPVTRHITEGRVRRQYYTLQLITFLSAIVGAKLVFLCGEFQWPFRPIDNWQQVLYSGRSIIGALIFGLLGAELAKPFLRYPLPPNDRFAAQLPFAFAIGRIGCLSTGCCRGIAYNGPGAITYSDAIPRHPIPAYEMLFHVLAGLIAIWLVRNRRMTGCVFSLYLIAYGIFRFLSEFIRETPKSFGSFSAYQWLSIVMVLLGMAFLLKRKRFPAGIWNANVSDDHIIADNQ